MSFDAGGWFFGMDGKDGAKDPDGNRIEFMQLHPDSPQMNS
ncbi:hypothetical protein [Paenibacillus sp. N3/727]|nr:hypothetical protein [Paenibacillus sp. N3/727]